MSQATSARPSPQADLLNRIEEALKHANERNKGRPFEDINRENLERMAKMPKIELKNPPQI